MNNNVNEFTSLLNANGFILESPYKDEVEHVIVGYDDRFFSVPPYMLRAFIENNLFDSHTQNLFLIRDFRLIERLKARREKLDEDAMIQAAREIEQEKVTGIEPEFIFFIKQNRLSPIKIGKTNNLDRRIRDLILSSPYGITVLGYIKTINGSDVLKTVHDVFSEYRLNGDWFDISKQDVALLIKQYNEQ